MSSKHALFAEELKELLTKYALVMYNTYDGTMIRWLSEDEDEGEFLVSVMED